MAAKHSLITAGVAALAIVLTAPRADAKKAFAKKEHVECSRCHVNPKGGGARNLVGNYYQVKKALPANDDDPEVQRVVDDWMDGLMAVPPVVTWRYVPLSAMKDLPPPIEEPASDGDVLRRMSLDLRGTVPSRDEVEAVLSKRATLEEMADRFLATREFEETFRLYHMDLIRPRTGDYNQPASYTKLESVTVGGKSAYRSTRVQGDDCSAGSLVDVTPYWDRKKPVPVCKTTADERTTIDGAACDSAKGQESGRCGCGPHLVFCYRDADKKSLIGSMKEEAARTAMEIVQTNRPYTELLTADWTMNNGRLETFYAKLAGTMSQVADPDWQKPWRRVERDPRHSGVLSTPEMHNFFYNGRRWAQRVFEAFFCHETTPDFDLLDDLDIAGVRTAVPYRDQPEMTPTITVTEGRACAACHVQLDSLARVRDRWDYWGQYHERDAREKVIPQTVTFLGREVDGLDEFGRALAGSEVFHDCVATQLWTHLVGHKFRPDEIATRKALVRGFEASNYDFKALIRAVVRTPEYRARASMKMMTRELYKGSFVAIVGAPWPSKNGGSLFDQFYDKIGGMDYRKIEFRDRRPGLGHALVQYKAAAESCDDTVEFDLKQTSRGTRRLLPQGPTALTAMPTDAELDSVLEDWYLRMFARPIGAVPEDELKIVRDLFADVARQSGPKEAYKAVCTTLLASSDFAVF